MRAAVFLVLAAACKETVPLVIAFMGAYFAVRKRSPWPLVVTLLGVAWFAVAVWVVIPHYNGDQSAFISRYGDYGSGAGEVAKNALLHPGQTAEDLFSESNLRYWLALLWPLGLHLAAEPADGAHRACPSTRSTRCRRRCSSAASSSTTRRSRSPSCSPPPCSASSRLWRWLGGGFRKSEELMRGERVQRSTLALLVLLCALAGNFVLGPLPFSLPGAAYDGADYAKTSHDVVLDEAVALIPEDARVSANNNVGAQLAARRVAYIFPYFAEADWVIVDQRHPFFYDKEDEKMHSLALGRLVLDPNFRSVFAKDGVLVFERIGAGGGSVPGAQTPAATPSPGATASPGRSLRVWPVPQATQLKTANFAVNAMSSTTPTATTTLCARGRSRVYSARATYSGKTVSVKRGYDISGTYLLGKKSGYASAASAYQE